MGSFGLQNSCHPVWQSRGACWWSRRGWHGRPPCRHTKAPPSTSAWSSKLPPSFFPRFAQYLLRELRQEPWPCPFPYLHGQLNVQARCSAHQGTYSSLLCCCLLGSAHGSALGSWAITILFISGDCWPSLKNLDLLPPGKLHSGTWGMERSSILLKNLTPLVVRNVLGGKNLLIFGSINVTIHLTDLPGTSILDVTPKVFPPPNLTVF